MPADLSSSSNRPASVCDTPTALPKVRRLPSYFATAFLQQVQKPVTRGIGNGQDCGCSCYTGFSLTRCPCLLGWQGFTEYRVVTLIDRL